jgi:HEAT repeat protein
MQSRRILFISMAVIFAAAFAWFVLKPREPSYQGKTLTAWLEEETTNGVEIYPEADPAAINAIRQIGTNAIPTLLKLAAVRDTPFRRTLLKAAGMLNEKCGIDLHVNSYYELQALSCRGFFCLGPQAKPAVPGLIALLHDDDEGVCEVAVYDLGYIGPESLPAVPDLIKEFERETADTNESDFAAAWAIGKIGPSAKAAVPVFTEGLTNNSLPYRMTCQAALINLHAASITPILEQLKDTTNMTQWHYAKTIALSCGTNASPAVPLFISALNCTNQRIQSAALSSLGFIRERADISIPAIVPFLASKNDYSRHSALRTLRMFGKAAKPAVPELITCLSDPNILVRKTATNALREIDPEAAAKAGIK